MPKQAAGTGLGPDLHAAVESAWENAKKTNPQLETQPEPKKYVLEISIWASNPIHSYHVDIYPAP